MPSRIPPSETISREPQLLRFGLRQMFFIVTLLSILCALLTTTSGAWPIVIGIAAVLVAGHVVGNLIGTRLRDSSQEVRRWRLDKLGRDDDQPNADTGPVQWSNVNLPQPTPLSGFGRTCGWMNWLIGGGTLLGAISGTALLSLTIGERITWAGLTVGTVSCAVLGAWLAFLASSFSTIARHAWQHARENEK